MVDTLTLDATQRAATGTFHGGRRGFFPTSGPQFLLGPAPWSPSFHTRPLSSLPHIPAITASTLPPQVPPASVKSAVGISINIPSVGAREPATTGTKREPPKVVIKRPDTLQESANFVIMLAIIYSAAFHLHGNTVERADSVEELLPSVPIGSSGIRVPLRDQLNAIVTYVSCSQAGV
ncbi:hypothetical protein NEUTE2DRAFT_124484 [Neurospora tetrasperma FGSC 2509]|nr:hypothetical protein NEUTE2DRAFT_124484 [Neurospora tetrasperma FGSC 2509]